MAAATVESNNTSSSVWRKKRLPLLPSKVEPGNPNWQQKQRKDKSKNLIQVHKRYTLMLFYKGSHMYEINPRLGATLKAMRQPILQVMTGKGLQK